MSQLCLSSLVTEGIKGDCWFPFWRISFLSFTFFTQPVVHFLYTLVSSCPPSTRSSLRRFQYLALPSDSWFLSNAQHCSLAHCVPWMPLWQSSTGVKVVGPHGTKCRMSMSQSTTTHIPSCPSDHGSPAIKWIEMLVLMFNGMGRDLTIPARHCREVWLRW
jgi:hypothetical protein